MRIIVGISGASGIVVGLRLVEVLKSRRDVKRLEVIVTAEALRVFKYECVSESFVLSKLRELNVDAIYADSDVDAPPSSSSYVALFDWVVVAPASVKSLALISRGIGSGLLTRVVLAALRLGRGVVAVVREAPLGVAELEVLLKAARLGVRIVPAVVGFYSKPETIKDVVDFIVGKVLDVMGVEHDLYARWLEAKQKADPDPCRLVFGGGES